MGAALVSRLLALALVAAAAHAQPFDRMKRQTVQIRVGIYDSSGRRFSGWGGSGFVIGGGRHVVTNWHVCCSPATGGQEAQRRIQVFLSADTAADAKTVWDSMQKDLAVIRLDRDSGRPPVSFAPRRVTADGQRVYALGFPGAADVMTDEAGRAEVKIADGIISASVRGNPNRPLLGNTLLYQTTITTNPGNSGGPVFDECGRVVATHSSSAPQSVGVKFSIQVDELLPALAPLGIKADVASERCASGSVPPARDPTYDYLILGGQAATALLALAAIGMAATRRGRDYVKKVTTSYHRKAPPPGPRKKGRPVLKGISGYYSGTVLELEDETFTLGRDSRAANLVFPPDTGNVSRRHCSVRYDAMLDRFILEDSWSTNGTYLDNGEQITAGQPYELKSADRFYVGDRENTFEVSTEEGG